MNTTEKGAEPLDPYDAALSVILNLRKTEIRATFPQLARDTGMDMRTIKRLLAGDNTVKFGFYIRLCAALGLDPSDTVDAVEARVAKMLE